MGICSSDTETNARLEYEMRHAKMQPCTNDFAQAGMQQNPNNYAQGPMQPYPNTYLQTEMQYPNNFNQGPMQQYPNNYVQAEMQYPNNFNQGPMQPYPNNYVQQEMQYQAQMQRNEIIYEEMYNKRQGEIIIETEYPRNVVIEEIKPTYNYSMPCETGVNSKGTEPTENVEESKPIEREQYEENVEGLKQMFEEPEAHVEKKKEEKQKHAHIHQIHKVEKKESSKEPEKEKTIQEPEKQKKTQEPEKEKEKIIQEPEQEKKRYRRC